MTKPIRVLHLVGAMYPGGMENFIMNLYEKIDRTEFWFDFVVHQQKENDYREQIEEWGGRVYEIPRLTKRPFASLRMLYQIIKKNQYDIVIRHTANALITPQLFVAKLAGAKTICHSHSETDPKMFLHRLGRLLMGRAADQKLACSYRAGKWMYGNQKFQVIHNAINVDRFIYDETRAERIREEFGLQDSHVYGHIGNFTTPKNHMFLLAVYHEIGRLDPKAVFFCLGEGELRSEIEAEIRRLGMEKKVILTGMRPDAESFMSCFDLLLFPSLFEGLPLTLIEAQAAGLKALISDRITENVVITENLITRKSLDEKPAEWAKKAVELAAEGKRDRGCQREAIEKAGYDMNSLAKWYEAYFHSLVNVGK
ncbi:MAG: glycosyltransferase family 1 protein [Lachnospiraceae bacterium]|nr:glycosyltransferase family 1 protein [Lachnospiraceae bacterium]